MKPFQVHPWIPRACQLIAVSLLLWWLACLRTNKGAYNGSHGLAEGTMLYGFGQMGALLKNERYLRSHQISEDGQLLASVLSAGGGWLHQADSSELVET